MSNKHYKVKKDTFMWLAGAILHNSGNSGGYVAIEDIWNKVNLSTEYISAHIIENPENAGFFERVYPDNITGKLFKTKDQLLELYNGTFKA